MHDMCERIAFRAVTLASRVVGLGFLGKACLTPLIEKYSGSGGGRPPGMLRKLFANRNFESVLHSATTMCQ